MVGPQGPAGLGARPARHPQLQQFRALSRQSGVLHKFCLQSLHGPSWWQGPSSLRWWGSGASKKSGHGSPKAEGDHHLPSGAPIQGVGGGCLSMFPATSRRSVEHALRQEEQLLPAAKVIVRGQSFCQNFAPQRPGSCWNMPEGWRARGLDFSNGRQGL